MVTSVLETAGFWRVLGERLARQAGQTAAPVLAAVAASGGTVNLGTLALSLAGVEAVTLVKLALQYFADVHADPAAAWYWQFLDRAVPAAAGVFAGVQVVSWQDALTVDWGQVGQKAVLAAVIAQLAVYVAPARFTAHRDVDVPGLDSAGAL